MKRRTRFEENSVSTMAQASPKGMPITIAPAVTKREPTIIGQRPKSFSEGYQLVPVRKLFRPYLNMIGVPWPTMNTVMTRRTETAEKATTSRARRTSRSLRSSRFPALFPAVPAIAPSSPACHRTGRRPSFLTMAWPSSDRTKSMKALA